MSTPLLGRDLPPKPEPDPVDGTRLSLARWRDQPKVTVLMTGWPGTMAPERLAETGPCLTDVRAWHAQAQEPGTGWGFGSAGQVPVTSLVWALADLAGKFPVMSLDAGMAWALTTVRRRGSIVECADAWFQPLGVPGLEYGWLFEAAGMDPSEVARLPGRPGAARLDRQALMVMAGLRGVPVPSRLPRLRGSVQTG